MQNGDRSWNQSGWKFSESLLYRCFNRIWKIAIGATATLIIGLLGIAGNYGVLPCQRQISAGISCFGGDNSPHSVSSQSEPSPLPPPDSVHTAPKPPSTPSAVPGPALAHEISESVERLAALRFEAGLWRRRLGIEYHDFSPAENAITEDDKQRFGIAEKEAWDQLTAAETLIAWSNQGLNAATKARLPIAVAKENAFDVDYDVAQRLSEKLQKDGFNIVGSTPEAALLVEVSDVNARSEQSGRRFSGSYNAEWDSVANLRIRAVWIGGKKVLFAEHFSGRASADNQEGADEAARNDALARAKEQLLTLATRR